MQVVDLDTLEVARQDDLVAITTPIPDQLGNVSSKTPIFHLPIYRLKLAKSSVSSELKHHERPVEFHCDLADLTDLIFKLKQVENQWVRSSQHHRPRVDSA